MSWSFYGLSIAFFTALIAVFLSVAWSVLLQIRENYHLHFQKSDLQWTGQRERFPRGRINPFAVLAVALVIAWLLVQFVIQPN